MWLALARTGTDRALIDRVWISIDVPEKPQQQHDDFRWPSQRTQVGQVSARQVGYKSIGLADGPRCNQISGQFGNTEAGSIGANTEHQQNVGLACPRVIRKADEQALSRFGRLAFDHRRPEQILWQFEVHGAARSAWVPNRDLRRRVDEGTHRRLLEGIVVAAGFPESVAMTQDEQILVESDRVRQNGYQVY
jgi:hypothetical protein